MGEAGQEASANQVSLELPLDETEVQAPRERPTVLTPDVQDGAAGEVASEGSSVESATRRPFQRIPSASSGLRIQTSAHQDDGNAAQIPSGDQPANGDAHDVDAHPQLKTPSDVEDGSLMQKVGKLAKRMTMSGEQLAEAMDVSSADADIMPLSALRKPEHNGLFIEGMLNPHGNLRLLWDFCMVMFLCYTMFSEPVFMGFEIDPEGPFHVMEYVVIVFFLADVCVNFRTAFENAVNKTLVTDQRQIAWRYITGWFVIDLCSSLPIELIIKKDDSTQSVSQAKVGAKIFKSTKFTKAVKIVRLLKLTKLARTVSYVHELEDFLGAPRSLHSSHCEDKAKRS
jgi:hypothetical protein